MVEIFQLFQDWPVANLNTVLIAELQWLSLESNRLKFVFVHKVNLDFRKSMRGLVSAKTQCSKL